MKIINIVGARPNFMKIAPLQKAMDNYNQKAGKKFFKFLLVHTGQHYDYEMSKVFFDELKIPKPDIYLKVGSGNHGEQTAKVMLALEKVLIKEKPDLVVVVGDVNSTLAGAITAVKLHIPVAHIEAGLRSFDKTMPEEINRILTDQISDFLFTPSEDANKNLIKEGIDKKKIFLVGDIMIDSLVANLKKAANSQILKNLKVKTNEYAVLTLHRPANVDNKKNLQKIISALNLISKKIPIIFPIHPRTKKQIKNFGFNKYFNFRDLTNGANYGINCITPLGYLDFLCLMRNAKFILTDSGGIQEETTFLNVPCLTLRDTTERPITIEIGTNTLVHNNPEKIIFYADKILKGKYKKGICPKDWDGKTAERIVKVLLKKFC